MKKLFSCLLAVVFALLPAVLPVTAAAMTSIYDGTALGINAEGAVLADLNSGLILYEKNKDQQCRPASLTKMMSLLVAYELLEGKLDGTVTVTKEGLDVPDGSSSANLLAGDILTYRDLCYGMMLPSGNDAAKMLSIATAGSEEAFVEKMNEKAQALGMTGTHYANAHGFEAEGHYTTPMDLTTLSAALVENEVLTEIFSTYRYTTTIQRETDGVMSACNITFQHHHPMMAPGSKDYMEGIRGIKTGYTSQAGNCLASYYERNGRRLIAVVTKDGSDGQRVQDTKALLNYGLQQFSTINLAQLCASKSYVTDVENADPQDEYNGQLTLMASRGEDTYLTVNASVGTAISALESPLSVRKPAVQAPVEKGETVGKIEFVYNGEVIFSTDAVASRTVDANYGTLSDLSSLGIRSSHRFSLAFLGKPGFLIPFFSVLLLAALFVVFLRFRRRRQRLLRRHQTDRIGRTVRTDSVQENGNRFFFGRR